MKLLSHYFNKSLKSDSLDRTELLNIFCSFENICLEYTFYDFSSTKCIECMLNFVKMILIKYAQQKKCNISKMHALRNNLTVRCEYILE